VTENEKKSPTIEAQLTQLAEIVEKLENGDLSLEDSLTYFEQGIALTKACHGTLEAAEKKIQQLTDERARDDA